MKARWIYQNDDLDEFVIGQAIVASWWPGRFHLISTICQDSEISRIWATEETSDFITQIARCDENGFVKSWSNTPFRKEYATLEEAREGHLEAVRLMGLGKMKFS